MKEKIATDRAILGVDAEHSKLPLWDMMAMCEGAAIEEIKQFGNAKGVNIDALNIMFDWRRESKPECFILRAWTVIDVQTSFANPEVIKAARELLGWTQGQLASKAKLGYSTVADYERKSRQHTWESTIQKMIRCLEKAGIEFVSGGARLKANPITVWVVDMKYDSTEKGIGQFQNMFSKTNFAGAEVLLNPDIPTDMVVFKDKRGSVIGAIINIKN